MPGWTIPTWRSPCKKGLVASALHNPYYPFEYKSLCKDNFIVCSLRQEEQPPLEASPVYGFNAFLTQPSGYPPLEKFPIWEWVNSNSVTNRVEGT